MKRSPSYRSQSRNSSNDRVYDDRNNAKNKTPQKNDDPKVPGHIGKPPPQIVYPHLSSKDKPFSGRCQLFVGNVPNDMKDNEFRNLFEKFGPCKDVFVNSNRGFGFIKLETRQLAEKARAELDGIPIRGGRYLRVRMACHHAAIKIKYLPLCISNELLESTFSMFGEIERAVVIVDDKGKPVGEGIVEFARKQSAFNAINRISEGVFFMTNQPRPIEVEKYEPNDELDGLPELFVFKTPELLHEREQGARFAPPGSLEADMGHKWKKLYLLYKEQEDLLKKNFAEEVSKLEADQANLAIEQRKHMIMQDVQRRQEELRILEKRIDENKRKMENMRKDDDQKPRLFDDDMRQMVMKGEDSLLHRRPTDSTKSLDPPFITRGVERSAAPGALQPPAAPPGIRLGGMGAYMGNTLLGTSPGMQRVGLLTRPPLNTALLGDPKVKMETDDYWQDMQESTAVLTIIPQATRKFTKISNEDRKEIIFKFVEGYSVKSISSFFGIKYQTVNSIVKKYLKTGQTTLSKRGGDMKSKLTQEMKDNLIRYMENNGRKTLKELSMWLYDQYGLSVSLSTVDRTLIKMRNRLD